MDGFRAIADPIHFSILSLLEVTGFDGSAKSIVERLGISLLEARIASDRLVRMGFVEKEKGRYTAFGARGGLGAGYFLAKKVVVGLEARIAKVFFKDRYKQTYLFSGIPNATGFFYGGNASIRYFF
jgi:hypothetical protein